MLICSHSPFLPFSPKQLLMYSISVDLRILDISYKWNHTVCGRQSLSIFALLLQVCSVHIQPGRWAQKLCSSSSELGDLLLWPLLALISHIFPTSQRPLLLVLWIESQCFLPVFTVLSYSFAEVVVPLGQSIKRNNWFPPNFLDHRTPFSQFFCSSVSQPWHCRHCRLDNSSCWGLSCALQDV